MTAEQPIAPDLPQVVNLSHADVELVQAGMVRANQANLKSVSAEEVDLQTCIACSIQAAELRAADSVLGLVTSGQVAITNSMVGSLHAKSVTSAGISALVVADRLTANEMKTLAVLGMDVKSESIKTGLLISRNVQGDVTTTLDGRTALMIGAMSGVVAGLILLAGRLLLRRSK